MKKTTRLRQIFESPTTTLMPFGVLPIHAQMAESAGFPAFEISGAMSAWWLAGVADVGYRTMTEVVQQAATVARSVDIPIFCDADAGYGGPVNVWRAVEEFIRAGVAGIHIEDQVEPKKAGGQPGIDLVSDGEAVGRLRAALDARDGIDPDFVIVARTDGYGARGGSLNEAIRRGNLYKSEAGADVIFYEGLPSWEAAREAIKATPGPAYAIVSRNAGPTPSVADLTAMRQTISIVPFVLPGVQEVWDLLLRVRDTGELAPIDEYLASKAIYTGTERFVGRGDGFGRPGYAQAREMERRYLPAELQREYGDNADVD